jgi:hypothetical protein
VSLFDVEPTVEMIRFSRKKTLEGEMRTKKGRRHRSEKKMAKKKKLRK